MCCETNGMSTPTGLCAAGYYCDGGSETAMPMGADSGFCIQDYNCPEGSTEMTPCTPGYYCGTDYLNTTSGQCQDGYCCVPMTTMPNPTYGTAGQGFICVLTIVRKQFQVMFQK